MATVIPRTRFKTLGILEPPLSSRKSEGYQVGPGAQSATLSLLPVERCSHSSWNCQQRSSVLGMRGPDQGKHLPNVKVLAACTVHRGRKNWAKMQMKTHVHLHALWESTWSSECLMCPPFVMTSAARGGRRPAHCVL